MTSTTIPAPPPEDDGGTLHTLTLDVARETIAVLKEREAEHLAQIHDLTEQLERERHLHSMSTRRLQDEVAILRAREGF